MKMNILGFKIPDSKDLVDIEDHNHNTGLASLYFFMCMVAISYTSHQVRKNKKVLKKVIEDDLSRILAEL